MTAAAASQPLVRFIAPQDLGRGLPPGRIHGCVMATPAHVEPWLVLLDEQERHQAGQFRCAPHRRDYIAAHGLTRILLAAALQSAGCHQSAKSLRFGRPPNGKPRLLGTDPDLRFSLSHTDGLVACAVTEAADIGIDVEAIREHADLAELAPSIFTVGEIAVLRAAPAEARARTFFRLWTMKEAFVKATGEGLGRSLQSFSVQLEPLQVRLSCCHRPLAQWHFHQTLPTERHVLALAMTDRA